MVQREIWKPEKDPKGKTKYPKELDEKPDTLKTVPQIVGVNAAGPTERIENRIPTDAKIGKLNLHDTIIQLQKEVGELKKEVRELKKKQ